MTEQACASTDSGSRDDEVARRALTRYDFSAQRRVRMINLSENATYLVEDPSTGHEGILRVHREDYHPREAIESELDWLAALRAEDVVSTPAVIPATDGERVIGVDLDGVERHAVLFELMSGLEPDEVALDDDSFRTLGGITARMHRHARVWHQPDGFQRFAWDWEHSLGSAPRWGRWQDGIGVGPAEEELLGEAVALIGSRLASYGDGPDRFGLVHADLRVANLLVDGDEVNVIDFDDCGFSWYMYDFGTAVSFIEDDPRLGQWQDAWLAGYREVADLDAEHVDMLATFVMLRRMLLVAWMGSHAHSRECQEKGPSYTAASCRLAERYLATGGRSLT